MTMVLSNLAGRANFGRLLNDKRLLGAAVEIGTHRGDFAARFLRQWKGKKLYCVDPWLSGYDPEDPASAGHRESDYQIALHALKPFEGRVKIIQETSVEAAARFKSGTVDFVYIDGCHQYKSVLEDLETWWPKIRPNGIMAGHDIVCNTVHGWAQYVDKAVRDFAGPKNLGIRLVPELPRRNWSYYFFKPARKPTHGRARGR